MEKQQSKEKVLKLSDIDRKVIHTYLNKLQEVMIKPVIIKSKIV
jgi:predicted RNA-binding protein Jag